MGGATPKPTICRAVWMGGIVALAPAGTAILTLAALTASIAMMRPALTLPSQLITPIV